MGGKENTNETNVCNEYQISDQFPTPGAKAQHNLCCSIEGPIEETTCKSGRTTIKASSLPREKRGTKKISVAMSAKK